MRMGRLSSVLAAGRTWRSAPTSASASKRTSSPSTGSHTGELVGRQRLERELGTARGDAGGVVGGLELDRAGLEGPDDVVDQPAGHHGDAVGETRHGDAHRHGELEIGAREGQLVAGELQAHAGQHRQRAPIGDGPAGGGQRLGEDVSLATQLHGELRSFCLPR